MDFSKFSDESFDVKEWINNALQMKSTLADNQVSSLVMKLQLCIQEVNKSLEETSRVALNNIPRVLREVESVKTEASVLKNQMAVLKDDIRLIEENTSQSMKELMLIDSIKNRMQSTSLALQEADNWSKSSLKVTEAALVGDVEQVAQRLISMQKSLQHLKDSPDFADYVEVLESHKNKLEAMLSPKLVHIFNNHNLEDAKYYVGIFEQLNRLTHLQTYYNNCHKTSILNAWISLRDEKKPLASWLAKFYEHLLSLWHQEVSWCSKVFPQPLQILSSLLAQSLSNLQPSLNICIQENVNEAVNPLQLLLEIKTVTARFEKSLRMAVLSAQNSSDDVSILSVIDLVNAPFSNFLLRYSSLQQDYLMKHIDQLKMTVKDLSDIPEVIADSTNLVFKYAQEASQACWQFTHGYGVCGLHEALQIFLSAYFELIDNTLSKFNQIAFVLPAECVWSSFQYSFKVIEVCGTLMTKFEAYRCGLCEEITNHVLEITQGNVSDDNYLIKARPAEWDFIMELKDQILSRGKEAILSASCSHVLRLNKRAHSLAFDLIFYQFKSLLDGVSSMEVWRTEEKEAAGGDLPKFSLSPQSYITQIGDSLLTLPQQLEGYFNEQNVSLIVSLKVGRLPFQETEGAHLDHCWLESLARSASANYVEAIIKIPYLTAYGTRQLLADIDYYLKILGALEVNVNEKLLTIQKLMIADPSSFNEVAAETGADESLIKYISTLRKIC
ncbi:conserved oligomeric Golgi complex subunit 7 isoform X2 [Hydra vulgaris]|uniref:Conserved oligomeric Golgi complex subunit 7 n=1 Tax=Hydra vulgaris TaxID=6087 RepID=A0ABM4BEH6_HYDVU